MRTNVRGRTNTARATNYTGHTGQSGWNKKTNRTKKTPTNVPVAYKNWNNNFQNKINSFRTLYNQTWGPAKCARPSTTTLTTFTNWINKGAIIQTVSPTQIAKWAKTHNYNFKVRTCTPTNCKNVLFKKFGKTTIKAVARTKSGSFMVVTAPTHKGKPFCFPK